MKDTDRILQLIDEYYRHAVLRPGMYFHTLECFENVVQTLESLRDQIKDLESPTPYPTHTYSDYLHDKGMGVATFTHRYKESHPEGSYTDVEFYKAYSDFLMGYLECGRKSQTSVFSHEQKFHPGIAPNPDESAT